MKKLLLMAVCIISAAVHYGPRVWNRLLNRLSTVSGAPVMSESEIAAVASPDASPRLLPLDMAGKAVAAGTNQVLYLTPLSHAALRAEIEEVVARQLHSNAIETARRTTQEFLASTAVTSLLAALNGRIETQANVAVVQASIRDVLSRIDGADNGTVAALRSAAGEYAGALTALAIARCGTQITSSNWALRSVAVLSEAYALTGVSEQGEQGKAMDRAFTKWFSDCFALPANDRDFALQRLTIAGSANDGLRRKAIEQALAVPMSVQDGLMINQMLGEFLNAEGDLDGAYKYYNRSLLAKDSVYSHNSGGISAIAVVCEKKQRYAEAAQLYEKALALQIDNAFALNGFAWSIVQAGLTNQYPAALERAKRAVELDASPATMDTLACLYHRMGQKRLAFLWAAEAVRASGGEDKASPEIVGRFHTIRDAYNAQEQRS
jgi:tetratricopeptide (TPR) repeat protein